MRHSCRRHGQECSSECCHACPSHKINGGKKSCRHAARWIVHAPRIATTRSPAASAKSLEVRRRPERRCVARPDCPSQPRMRRCAAQRLQRPSSPIDKPSVGLAARGRFPSSRAQRLEQSRERSPPPRHRRLRRRTAGSRRCLLRAELRLASVSARRRAAAIINGSASSAVTVAPCRASSNAIAPSPQPTSSSVLAVNPAEKSREQLPLKGIGDLAETTRSPPDVRPASAFPPVARRPSFVAVSAPPVMKRRRGRRSGVRPRRQFPRASSHVQG